MWMAGDRLEPRFSYAILSEKPLAFSDDVSYLDIAGAEQHILGTDTWHPRGEMVWRGKGIRSVLRSHWRIAGSSDDGTIAVVKFSKSLVTPGGIDVIVRDDLEIPELRAIVARDAERFGLSLEDFAALAWL
jgi:hypothetical protein